MIWQIWRFMRKILIKNRPLSILQGCSAFEKHFTIKLNDNLRQINNAVLKTDLLGSHIQHNF